MHMPFDRCENLFYSCAAACMYSNPSILWLADNTFPYEISPVHVQVEPCVHMRMSLLTVLPALYKVSLFLCGVQCASQC